MKTNDKPIQVCPYFNIPKCSKKTSRQYIMRVCLDDSYVNCNKFVNLEKKLLNENNNGSKR